MKTVVAAALMLCSIPTAHAEQIVLDGTNIVGASSVYGVGAGSAGTAFERDGVRVDSAYGAGNIFNSQLGEPLTEYHNSGQYFLTGDGQSSATIDNPYVTIDLGGLYSLLSFTLYNTTNGSTADRGTGKFVIFGANSLLDDGANGLTLGGVSTLLASGVLTQQVPDTAPIGHSFASLSDAAVRYLQFVPVSAQAPALYNAQSFGLNELKVFGLSSTPAVPEPATWGMMVLGFAAIGAILRRPRAIRLA